VTDHDIQTLVIGVCIGVYLMLAMQIGFQMRDNRRDRKAARSAKAKLKAARAVADLPQSMSTQSRNCATQSEKTPADLRESSEARR
jgi:hypothetical protein